MTDPVGFVKLQFNGSCAEISIKCFATLPYKVYGLPNGQPILGLPYPPIPWPSSSATAYGKAPKCSGSP